MQKLSLAKNTPSLLSNYTWKCNTFCNIRPTCVTVKHFLTRTHFTSLEQRVDHLPSSSDQCKNKGFTDATTLSQSIQRQIAIMDVLWTISWVSSPCLLAIWFLWQIWHWQSCDTSALLPAFGSVAHSDIFECSIQPATKSWSEQKTDFFGDLCKLVHNWMNACAHL